MGAETRAALGAISSPNLAQFGEAHLGLDSKSQVGKNGFAVRVRSLNLRLADKMPLKRSRIKQERSKGIE